MLPGVADDLRLAELAREANLAVPDELAASLESFAALARAWAARTDLVGARDHRELGEILFLDAMVLARPGLVEPGARVIDVGSGVGAPGLSLALLRPDLDVTLVEPRRRRVAFLRTAVGSLRLAGRVRILERRIDPAAPDVGRFDVALSRATFPPSTWLALGLRLAPVVLVMLAGGEPPAASACSADTQVDYRVPSSAASRRILRYRPG